MSTRQEAVQLKNKMLEVRQASPMKRSIEAELRVAITLKSQFFLLCL
jgi:hypothetical protein